MSHFLPHIPGSWHLVLIGLLLLIALVCWLGSRLERWAEKRRERRIIRRYAQYRPVPDARDSITLFHRLRRAAHYI